MKVSLTILNPDNIDRDETEPSSGKVSATWHARNKSYESDTLDDDMISSPVGNHIERCILDDIQITNKNDVDLLMRFLTNLSQSLQH